MKTQLQFIFAVALVVAPVCAPAQSSFRDLMDTASATMDAARESREQNAAASDVRAIFAKAKAAADDDDKLNLCGFYTGMSAADARTLVAHYALKAGEWTVDGDPVYKIHLSLKGVRRVTKGGNTFDELAQAVANRIGSLRQDWETKVYSLKTIDGISVTMSESSGFTMVDADVKTVAERKARESREAALEEARRAALAWKGESKSIPISDSVSIQLRSVPGGLWFGQYEVTQAQWEAVMGTKCQIPSFNSEFIGNDLPAVYVSWDDCQEFLKKLNSLPGAKESGLTFRLPTSEEWEAACRAGSTGDYCRLADGMEVTKYTLGQVAWFEDNSDEKTHPVGQKKPNAFGLYDMHGNVWEWTDSAVGDYRIDRGGSWFSSAGGCESSFRSRCSPSYRGNRLGFRLCASGRAD